jgi:hypothetical protein
MGDCWDGFLIINGFFMTIPVENPILGEPLIKKQLDIPSNEPVSLNINPLDDTMPSQSSHEQKFVESELSEPPVPNSDAGKNITVKPDVKKSCKQTKQKHIALGF